MFYTSISRFPNSGDMGRDNHTLLGPSVAASDAYGLVHALPILDWAKTLIPYVIARSKCYDIVHFGPSSHGFVLGFCPKRPHTI
jgi:hypothetical protein